MQANSRTSIALSRTSLSKAGLPHSANSARPLEVTEGGGDQDHWAAMVSSLEAISSISSTQRARLCHGFGVAYSLWDSAELLQTALAVKNLFLIDPLSSSKGSFDLVLLQSLILAVISEDNSTLRNQRLHRLFAVMESGLNRFFLDQLYREFGYRKVNSSNRRDRGLMTGVDTEAFVGVLRLSGLSVEQVVERINGTEHTAYLNNRDLAMRIVDVFEDISRTSVAEGRRLRQEVEEKIRAVENLEVADLIDLLRINPTKQVQLFLKMWKQKIFQIREERSAQFAERLQGTLTSSPEEVFALFCPAERANDPDQIILRKIDNRSTNLVAQVVMQLLSLVHEFEHVRQNSSRGETIRFNFCRMNQQERRLSELFAYLEELRWQVLHGYDETLQAARRLGLTPALYFKDNVDIVYGITTF